MAIRSIYTGTGCGLMLSICNAMVLIATSFGAGKVRNLRRGHSCVDIIRIGEWSE